MNAQPLLILDSTQGVTLQNRIRKSIVDAATAGAFGKGRRLPSSRALARQLCVARNTVVLACARLVDEGFLVSHPRSGLYINPQVVRSRAFATSPVTPSAPDRSAKVPAWLQRLQARGRVADAPVAAPTDWQRYAYPFVDGCCDPSLFPAAEWRDTHRVALSMSQMRAWSTDVGDADDPQLIEEICAKLLPRRGIRASADQILITLGVQHAFYLSMQVLVEPGMSVGIEEPGCRDLVELAREKGAAIVHQPVDDDGLIVDERLDACAAVFVSPSRQHATSATLSPKRREALIDKAEERDIMLIEDDSDCETTYGDASLPSLRALDRCDRVIYTADLARVLTPGLRLGFMVGPAAFIAEARRCRRLGMRHPPLANQRALALFLGLGHYDTTIARLARTFHERRNALRDALDYYLPLSLAFAPRRSGTTFWVRGQTDFDAQTLAARAAQRGILVENAAPFFSEGAAPRHILRMGISGVPRERIRDGVRNLMEVVREVSEPRHEPDWRHDQRLSGSKLRTALAGTTIRHHTNYGESCSIHVGSDGTLRGHLGGWEPETDIGVWSVNGDLWCRHWSDWGYGEPGAFHVAVRGERLAWFSPNGTFLGTSVLTRQ